MKVKTVKEVLIAARWILKHVGWCQGSYAQDANGYKVDPQSPIAASFCLSGVLNVVESDEGCCGKAWEFLCHDYCGGDVVYFNDRPGRTKEEVLSLLDDAIEKAP